MSSKRQCVVVPTHCSIGHKIHTKLGDAARVLTYRTIVPGPNAMEAKQPGSRRINGQLRLTECPRHRQFQPLVQWSRR